MVSQMNYVHIFVLELFFKLLGLENQMYLHNLVNLSTEMHTYFLCETIDPTKKWMLSWTFVLVL